MPRAPDVPFDLAQALARAGAALIRPRRSMPGPTPTGVSHERSESHLLVDRRDGILILTMNRPAVKNSLSPRMLVELAAAWHEFRDTRDLRVAILTGAGDEDFCAGGDLQLTMPLVTGARKPDKPDDYYDEIKVKIDSEDNVAAASTAAARSAPCRRSCARRRPARSRRSEA